MSTRQRYLVLVALTFPLCALDGSAAFAYKPPPGIHIAPLEVQAAAKRLGAEGRSERARPGDYELVERWARGQTSHSWPGSVTRSATYNPVCPVDHPRPSRSVVTLISELKDSDPCVRHRAGCALQHRLKEKNPEAKQAVPALVKALQDSNPDVRSVAAVALGYADADAKEVVHALQSAMKDPIGYVRYAAELSLSKIDQTPRETVLRPAKAWVYRGDASRCGYTGGPSPGQLAPSPLWQFAEQGALYFASPLVVGDVVYGASCTMSPFGTSGTIFCLDAATGRKRWLTSVVRDPQTGDEKDFRAIFSSPALSADGKYLVIGQGLHDDAGSELICLDAQTGALHWLLKTPLHIENSPAIEGDVAVVGAGAIEEGPDDHVHGHPGLVVAVRISDGKKLWEYQVTDPESPPAIADGVVYAGSGMNGNAVVALRMQPDAELQQQGQQRLLWKTPTPNPVTSAITLADGLVLAGCGTGTYDTPGKNPRGAVVALDRNTGMVRWQVTMPGAVFGAIAVRNGKVICPTRSGEVVALDIKQAGRIVWRRALRGASPVLAAPAVTDEHVFAVTRDGYLFILGAADGSVLGEYPFNSRDAAGDASLCTSSPWVTGGRVYVAGDTGGLRCYGGAGTLQSVSTAITQPDTGHAGSLSGQ